MSALSAHRNKLKNTIPTARRLTEFCAKPVATSEQRAAKLLLILFALIPIAMKVTIAIAYKTALDMEIATGPIADAEAIEAPAARAPATISLHVGALKYLSVKI